VEHFRVALVRVEGDAAPVTARGRCVNRSLYDTVSPSFPRHHAGVSERLIFYEEEEENNDENPNEIN
jgi:hypothetical protein